MSRNKMCYVTYKNITMYIMNPKIIDSKDLMEAFTHKKNPIIIASATVLSMILKFDKCIKRGKKNHGDKKH